MLRIKGVLGVYIGFEYDNTEPKIISKAWFRELTPPWRVGHGLRIRIGPMRESAVWGTVTMGAEKMLLPLSCRAIQVGTYTKNTEEDMTPLKQLGGRELPVFDPSEIGAWRGQGVQIPDQPEPPDAA
jgi:hypothetical protein